MIININNKWNKLRIIYGHKHTPQKTSNTKVNISVLHDTIKNYVIHFPEKHSWSFVCWLIHLSMMFVPLQAHSD